MKKPFYLVTAQCSSPKCRHREFTVERKQVVKINSAGQQYEINNIVCPVCRMWAYVTRIERAE
ncbi:MAG: hypothetical protein AB1427_00790 [Thermodesulfobacteriota bacterium]